MILHRCWTNLHSYQQNKKLPFFPSVSWSSHPSSSPGQPTSCLIILAAIPCIDCSDPQYCPYSPPALQSAQCSLWTICWNRTPWWNLLGNTCPNQGWTYIPPFLLLPSTNWGQDPKKVFPTWFDRPHCFWPLYHIASVSTHTLQICCSGLQTSLLSAKAILHSSEDKATKMATM